MNAPRKRTAEVDPAPSLLMILVRHIQGWYEKRELADALGVTPSQITMWDRRVRQVPYERLEQAFDLANIPRSLIDPSLRFLRSFLDAAEGKNRGDLALETTLAAEILPLILSAADLIREPLARTRRNAAERSDPREQWARLKRRTPEERLLLVEEGEELQSRELAELIAAESVAREGSDPREAAELAELARRVGELVPG